jgi:hypothetical protein
MFKIKSEKSYLESLSLLLWTQAERHFNTEFLRTIRLLGTNVVTMTVARNDDKLSTWKFVYLFILNVVHPFTLIAIPCTCSTRGPWRCQFSNRCNELSPLFGQNTDMNMLLKAEWTCTMLKSMIKLYFDIYFEFLKNSRFFWKSVYM